MDDNILLHSIGFYLKYYTSPRHTLVEGIMKDPFLRENKLAAHNTHLFYPAIQHLAEIRRLLAVYN